MGVPAPLASLLNEMLPVPHSEAFKSSGSITHRHRASKFYLEHARI